MGVVRGQKLQLGGVKSVVKSEIELEVRLEVRGVKDRKRSDIRKVRGQSQF